MTPQWAYELFDEQPPTIPLQKHGIELVPQEVFSKDALREVVEGLRRINTLAVHNHTDAFDPTRWLIEIAEESQHLSAQLEAHRRGGLDG